MFSIKDVAKQSNLILAYNRLLTNPESTYKNFFRDSYSAYGIAIEKNITLLRSKMKSGYLPTNTIRVFMPKANGLSRMYTLMSIEDQIVYQAYLLAPLPNELPPVNTVAPYAQNIFKQAGVIQRSRYSNSQIARYLKELVGIQQTFSWKKKLGKEHDQIERTLFIAMGYWKTDLTAFVNLWDTMDDRICSLITKDHIELGGYTLGKIGAINRSKGFIGNIPKFHKMCMELHRLRLHSHLSHSEIRDTHQYTGPIPQSKRKAILKLIDEGIRELIQFW